MRKKSFEAVVQKTVTQSDGEIRLIVERTTEIYGSPLAKLLQISVLTVQKAYEILQEDDFIETTAGKGYYVSVQNQDFYLEEQQKKIEGCFNDAIEIARTSRMLDHLLTA